jgi:alkylation response protein AidB-like acyl-CoA dehydrogenase
MYPIGKIGQSVLPFSDVILDDVVLEESYRLHGRSSGFPQLFHLLESGRLFVCATCLGLAEAAMQDAVFYARERKAFGERIADFQLIQQKIVDMQVKIDNMRNLTYKAAMMLERADAVLDARLEVALAKRYIPRTATEVASEAMQILGGRGYTVNKRVSSIWEDCRGFQISEGTDEIMVRIAAPLIFDEYERSFPS